MDFNLILSQYVVIFLAGAVGAFLADILKDNCIELPKNIGGRFFLGSFGGLIVGGAAGLIIDGSMLTAFMGGFVGKEIITRLIDGNFPDLLITKNKNASSNLDRED
jgi:uncharacterized membrane protein